MSSEEEWDTKIEIHKECPYKEKLIVRINPTYMRIIETLCKKYEDLEFSLYFNYEKIDDITVEITELTVPEQEVTHASVDYKKPMHSGGVIHKHPSGMKTFSSIDEEYINANHDISLLVVDSAFETGTARIKTPCGCLMEVDDISVEVSYEYDQKEVDKVLKECDEKITEHKYVNTCVVSYGTNKNMRFGSAFVDETWKNEYEKPPSTSECSVCYKTRRTKKMVKCIICGDFVCKSCATKGEHGWICTNCHDSTKNIDVNDYRY